MEFPFFNKWVRAKADEPRFGLIASDPEAPAAVLFWAAARRERLLTEIPEDDIIPEKLKEELNECTEAEQIAWLMQAYQRKINMTGKGASYHRQKLAEAVKYINEAYAFASTRGGHTPREIIDRAINTAKAISNFLAPPSKRKS